MSQVEERPKRVVDVCADEIQRRHRLRGKQHAQRLHIDTPPPKRFGANMTITKKGEISLNDLRLKHDLANESWSCQQPVCDHLLCRRRQSVTPALKTRKSRCETMDTCRDLSDIVGRRKACPTKVMDFKWGKSTTERQEVMRSLSCLQNVS